MSCWHSHYLDRHAFFCTNSVRDWSHELDGQAVRSLRDGAIMIMSLRVIRTRVRLHATEATGLLHASKAVMLAAFLLTTSGCSQVARRDLVGSYRLVYEFNGQRVGTEALVLFEDGTFRQVFHAEYGAAVSNVGTWRLEHFDRQTQVCLEGALEPLSPFNYREPVRDRIIWDLPIEMRGDSVELIVNDDLGQRYVKERPGPGKKRAQPAPGSR